MADSSSNVDQVIAGAGADQKVNENFDPASPAMLYGRRASTCSGLVFGYYGGRYEGTPVANGTVSATASLDNYVVANKTTGAVSISTATTDWNNAAGYLRLYLLSAGTTTVVSYQDFRQSIGASGGSGGGLSNPMTTAGDIIKGGVSGAPGRLGIGTAGQVLTVVSGDPAWAAAGGGGAMAWNAQTASYTLALGDADNGVAMNVASANNLTVPPNSTAAIPVGASVLVYQEGAGLTSIVAGAGVTIVKRSPLTLNSAGQYGLLTLIKRATNTWVLAGDLA